MDTVQLADISSREFKNYISEGGDLAVFPIGKTERLGPHLPLTARNYVVSAISNLIAQNNNGYCLPVLPYTTIKDLGKTPGSVDVSSDILYDLIKDIFNELVRNGIRQIIAVSYLDELYYIVNEYFQDKDIAPVWLSPDRIPVKEDNKHIRETSLIAASLKILGKEKLLNKVLEENEKQKGEYVESSESSGKAPFMNQNNIAIGYQYQENEYEILPVDKIFVDKTVSAIKNWIEEKNTSVKALREYNYYIDRGRFDRGLR
ncbi:MAG: creatininase family protein [Halanaerobiales bacterium]